MMYVTAVVVLTHSNVALGYLLFPHKEVDDRLSSISLLHSTNVISAHHEIQRT